MHASGHQPWAKYCIMACGHVMPHFPTFLPGLVLEQQSRQHALLQDLKMLLAKDANVSVGCFQSGPFLSGAGKDLISGLTTAISSGKLKQTLADVGLSVNTTKLLFATVANNASLGADPYPATKLGPGVFMSWSYEPLISNRCDLACRSGQHCPHGVVHGVCTASEPCSQQPAYHSPTKGRPSARCRHCSR